MLKVHGLGRNGRRQFEQWINSGGVDPFPQDGVFDDQLSMAELKNSEIDSSALFDSRFDWAKHLSSAFSEVDKNYLLSRDADSVWDWISAVFIKQLTNDFKSVNKVENYMVVRKGIAGALIHRNAPRTSYILYTEHGQNSLICLCNPLHVRGQITESLSSSQVYLLHKGFFEIAHKLYFDPVTRKFKSGAASKPGDRNAWKSGSRAGLGSMRRLTGFLGKLDNTYDTLSMNSKEMLDLLPKNEFKKFLE